MNREDAKLLNVKCDKNTIWPKLTMVVSLWCGCMDKNVIDAELMGKFRDRFLGYLVVAHDKGKRIKLCPTNSRGGIEQYTLLKRAMDVTGISIRDMTDDIRAMTIYPNGTVKIEYKDATEWL